MGEGQNSATLFLDAGNITDLAQEQTFLTKGIDKSSEFMNPIETVRKAIGTACGGLEDIQSNLDFNKNISTGAQEFKIGANITSPENFKGGITQSR